jgi:hypothetical protein
MVDYEWVIETRDEYDDIVDSNHRARISEFDPTDLAEALSGSEEKKLVLVRTTDEGDRCWAYVENGMLPAMMLDAYQVARHKVSIVFIREFEKTRGRLRDQVQPK